MFTGVDRVELAYFQRFVGDEGPLFGLARTSLGYILLDRSGMQQLLMRITQEQPFGTATPIARILHRTNHALARAESDLRRFSLARARKRNLGPMLKRHLPNRIAYYNTGHSNITSSLFRGIRDVPSARIFVLLHDTIPLDFPQFQRTGTVEQFREKLRLVQANADVIICNSEATRADTVRHMSACGSVPALCVAHLGHTPNCLPIGDSMAAPDILNPFFLCLGTIEPRKNHKLLLDIWTGPLREIMGHDLPHLVICGSRGWRNEDVFEQLDSLAEKSDHIHEYAGLDDAVINVLMKRSAGLLFPSFAEGFGLPLIEAAALGTPILCNTLPVIHEVLADIPIYAEVSDSYSWASKIANLARQDGNRDKYRKITHSPPTWDQHFNVVLNIA
jgi:glycosyltransferase involved in cell wall biosynthesis